MIALVADFRPFRVCRQQIKDIGTKPPLDEREPREVTRVAREVGTEGKLGGQAQVPGVAGTWKDLSDSVNFMAGHPTAQVRYIADVATAIAGGDLSKKITVRRPRCHRNKQITMSSAVAPQKSRVAYKN